MFFKPLSPGHLRPRFFPSHRNPSFREPLLPASTSCTYTRFYLQRVIARQAEPSDYYAVVPLFESAFWKDRRAALELRALRASDDTSTDVRLYDKAAGPFSFSAPRNVVQNLVELVQLLLAVRIAGDDAAVLP